MDNDVAPMRPMVVNFNNSLDLLASCYMRSMRHGGLFLPTPNRSQDMHPGAQVTLLLTLPGETTRRTLTGVIGWITPQHAASRSPEGIGVSFDDNPANQKLKAEIETMLAGRAQAPSNTL